MRFVSWPTLLTTMLPSKFHIIPCYSCVGINICGISRILLKVQYPNTNWGLTCKNHNPRWVSKYVKYWATRRRGGCIILQCTCSIVRQNIYEFGTKRTSRDSGVFFNQYIIYKINVYYNCPTMCCELHLVFRFESYQLQVELLYNYLIFAMMYKTNVTIIPSPKCRKTLSFGYDKIWTTQVIIPQWSYI